MGLKSLLDNSQCLSAVREVRSGGDTYVCLTRYSEQEDALIIGVCDGETIWTTTYTESKLKERCAPKDLPSYLCSLSETLCDGEVGVSLSGDTISLKCGSVDIFSLTQESKELRPFLFHLVGQLQSTKSRLKDLEGELSKTRKQAAADQQAMVDGSLGGPSGKKAINRPKRTAGASLVNPSRKRRKAATGVVFNTSQTEDD